MLKKFTLSPPRQALLQEMIYQLHFLCYAMPTFNLHLQMRNKQ